MRRRKLGWYILFTAGVVLLCLVTGLIAYWIAGPEIINDTPFFYEEPLYQYCAAAFGVGV